jgi:nicotinic acid mononucleotide adenylyltransferase
MAAKKRKIEIVEINGFATSSTMIRSRFIRDDFFQQDVDINVSNYICNN